MSNALELEDLHKYNKQGQIDLIYINLNDTIKKLNKYTETINAFISTFLSRTNTCGNVDCEYALKHDCSSCYKYNLSLTQLSNKLQFIDELYKEENPRLQEKINQRDKNQYTIHLIEHILNIKFNGNLNNEDDVQNFIKENLHKIINNQQ